MKHSYIQNKDSLIKTLRKLLVLVSLTLVPSIAFCALSGESIGTVASTITSSFSKLAQLITAAAYIAGMGFALTAILKFKQHKDNPTQIPIGTPIALLFIAAGLIFLPSIFGVANETIFGGSGEIGGVTGITGY